MFSHVLLPVPNLCGSSIIKNGLVAPMASNGTVYLSNKPLSKLFCIVSEFIIPALIIKTWILFFSKLPELTKLVTAGGIYDFLLLPFFKLSTTCKCKVFPYCSLKCSRLLSDFKKSIVPAFIESVGTTTINLKMPYCLLSSKIVLV